MGCLELRFWTHAVQTYERWDSKNSIVNWFDSCYTYKVPKFTSIALVLTIGFIGGDG